MKRTILIGLFCLATAVAGVSGATARSDVVDFGTAVPSIDQLRHAFGGQQRVLEFKPQNMAPPPQAAQPAAVRGSAVGEASSAARGARPDGARGLSMAIEFDLGSATIRPVFQAHIARVAEYLNSEPDLSVVIIGHTDARGPAHYNQTLSVARAESVRRALAYSYGVDPQRLWAEGRGEHEPRYGDGYDDRNRRVEFLVAD